MGRSVGHRTPPSAFIRQFLEQEFCELRLYGVLRSSHPVSQGGIIQVSSDPLGKRTEKEESPCRSQRYM